MPRKDFTPLIMALLLLGGLVGLAALRLWRLPDLWAGFPVNGDVAFVVLYVLWLLVEMRVSQKDVSREGKTAADRATCPLYGGAQAGVVLSALWFPSVWRAPNLVQAVGLALFLAGVVYRLWAVRTLGQFYSHRVRTVAGHRIVDSGPYRYTRHPAYAGMIVAHAGLALFFLNPVTVGLFLLALVPAILLRIVIEERTLFQIEGYPEYARGRNRLIPRLW